MNSTKKKRFQHKQKDRNLCKFDEHEDEHELIKSFFSQIL